MASMVLKFILVCLFVFAGVLPARAEVFTLETYPRVDGATVAIPLGHLMAEALIGQEQIKGRDIAGVTAFRTTHTAYINLITGKADVVFAFSPSDEEYALAVANNVKLILTPVGRDAFVFLAHRENPVNGLTLEQVRGIFSGGICNWSEVGGNDWAIAAWQREKNSGSQTFMEQAVMPGVPLAKSLPVSSGMRDVVDVVNYDKKAVAYSFYTFANHMYARQNIKLLAVDGLECSQENIRAELYPFTVTLYAVTRAGNPANDRVDRLLAWLAGEEGSAAIEKSNFVPLR